MELLKTCNIIEHVQRIFVQAYIFFLQFYLGSFFLVWKKKCVCIYTHISSVQLLSHVCRFVTPWTIAHQASLSITKTSRVCSNSSPSNWWCQPAITSSVVPLSSCLQSFTALGSFPVNQFFTSGGQSIGASASNQSFQLTSRTDLWQTGWISLQSKGFSRIFSNTTV